MSLQGKSEHPNIVQLSSAILCMVSEIMERLLGSKKAPAAAADGQQEASKSQVTLLGPQKTPAAAVEGPKKFEKSKVAFWEGKGACGSCGGPNKNCVFNI